MRWNDAKPSIVSDSLTGLEKLVSGYPNSIFFMLGAVSWIGGTVICMLLISKYYIKEIS